MVSWLLLYLSVAVNCVTSGAFNAKVFSFSHRLPTEIFTMRRQPRRNLKKRRNRRNRRKPDYGNEMKDDFQWRQSKPLVQSAAIEAGEDYWIDEKELEEFLRRANEILNRKPAEGEIPKDKLWEETLAPYRQNWIGTLSVISIIFATIVTKFPDLLDPPSPLIPDL